MKVLIGLTAIVAALFAWANLGTHDLPTGLRADRVLIKKSEHQLVLLLNGKILKAYRVALGSVPVGHKEREGDGRTPEGLYRIDSRKNDSAFHRALHISYPNPRDIEIAKSRGLDPGGAIMIHGIRNGLGWFGKLHRLADWTSGCVAVTNWEIEEIWGAVPDGTPIQISP